MNIQLNHINLTVRDVATTSDFFTRHFGFSLTEMKGDHKLAVLSGAGGFTLVLMSESFNRHGNNAYPDSFHIGFLVGTREQVLALYNSLKKDGVALEHEPASMRGVFGFYFTAPGNLLTEVSCALA